MRRSMVIARTVPNLALFKITKNIIFVGDLPKLNGSKMAGLTSKLISILPPCPTHLWDVMQVVERHLAITQPTKNLHKSIPFQVRTYLVRDSKPIASFPQTFCRFQRASFLELHVTNSQPPFVCSFRSRCRLRDSRKGRNRSKKTVFFGQVLNPPKKLFWFCSKSPLFALLLLLTYTFIHASLSLSFVPTYTNSLTHGRPSIPLLLEQEQAHNGKPGIQLSLFLSTYLSHIRTRFS